MRRPLRVFVALSLCCLALNPQPRSYRDTPPLISPSATPQASWSVLALRLDEQARWFQWASQLPAPKAAVKKPPRVEQVSYEPGSVESVICSVFAGNCAKAIAIAKCESGLNPSAYNRSGASGLFQLLGHGDMFEAHGWSASDWPDPYKNSVVAFDLSRGGTNWSAWTCRG